MTPTLSLHFGKSSRARRGLIAGLFAFAILAFTAAPAALADVVDSANWSGYAVHRSGVKFKKVSATWTQPNATCTPGMASYSAFWVGLGGYSLSSNALEQIGTEVDCSPTGAVRPSAWYELVPAPSRTIGLRVRPGDVVHATVSVVGHQVKLALDDETTKRSFSKTVHDKTVDVSSAEWIVEAPSECVSETACETLPLADFGAARFRSARVESTKGRTGSVSNRAWGLTELRLLPGGRRFVVVQGGDLVAGAATPSALTAGGSAFTISYAPLSIPLTTLSARAASVRDGYLVH